MTTNYSIRLTADIDIEKSKKNLEEYKKEAEKLLKETVDNATQQAIEGSSSAMANKAMKNKEKQVAQQEKLNQQVEKYKIALDKAKISDEQRVELQNKLKTALNGSLEIQTEIVQEYQDSLKIEEQKYATEMKYMKEKEAFAAKELRTKEQVNNYIEVMNAKIKNSLLNEEQKVRLAQQYEDIKGQEASTQKQSLALLNEEFSNLQKTQTLRAKILSDAKQAQISVANAYKAGAISLEQQNVLQADLTALMRSSANAGTQKLIVNQQNLASIKQELTLQQQMTANDKVLATRKAQIANTIKVYTYELQEAGIAQKQLVDLQIKLNTLTRELNDANDLSGMANVSTELRKWKIDLNDATQNSRSFTTILQENVKKFSQWLTAGTLVLQSVRMIKKMVNEVVELDKALTELAKVTDLSSKAMATFTDRARTAAIEIGRTTADMVYAAAEWSRAGYDIQEAFQLAEISLIMTNVSDGIDDVSEASSALISIMRGFSMEVTNAAYVLDVLNYTANNFAIDTDNLATILTKASGALALTNTEFEELVALGTAAFGVLRDADTVGSSLVFITARLKGMSEEGEKIVGLVPDIEKAFQKYTNGAVTMIDAQTGELRSTYAIMSDLAKVWDTLTSQEQAYIGEQVAGKKSLPSRYRNMLTETNLIAGKVFSNTNLKTNILQRKNEISLSVNVAKAEKNICMI